MGPSAYEHNSLNALVSSNFEGYAITLQEASL